MTNKDDPACSVALSRPNVASFLQSFDTPLLAASSRGDRQKFVQGTETGLDLGSVRNVLLRTLNLATGDGEQTLGGDATDGVGFLNEAGRYYAGIFSGTDLGAPVSGTNGTSATWSGRFGATVPYVIKKILLLLLILAQETKLELYRLLLKFLLIVLIL